MKCMFSNNLAMNSRYCTISCCQYDIIRDNFLPIRIVLTLTAPYNYIFHGGIFLGID